jgi:uridine kinase
VDFKAAEEARCLSIGVSYGYGYDDYKKFDFVANNPLDIYTIIRKINGIYKDVTSQILNRKQRNKPLIVGINGVDTSGKSTFTRELERYLYTIGFKSQIVAIDDFHNPSQIRNKEKDPVISYINNAFDIKKIEDELLKPVITDGILNKELLLLDIEKNEFINRKRFVVDEDTIILFEGVLLYREPLNQYFDFQIFIDVSYDEVLKRAVKRDVGLFGDTVIEKYKNKYIPIQKLYIERNSPKDTSDIIIDNNDYCNPKIIKQPYLNKREAITIKLEAIEEKHLYEIGKMSEENEAREMIGIVTVPILEDFIGKNNISKAIINKNNEFIGVVELFNISWKNRRAELSISIKQQMQGKGYGFIAINEMLEIAFVEYGFNRVFLRVLDINIKAINLYKKVGFTQEGICRGESLRRGRFTNQIQMSILSSEWIGKYQK